MDIGDREMTDIGVEKGEVTMNRGDDMKKNRKDIETSGKRRKVFWPYSDSRTG
jgi:hypothetical protein